MTIARMKAALLASHGTSNDLLAVASAPDPEAGPGEVVVALRAAALNRLDVFVRDGIPGVTLAMPHVPGADGAGVVSAVGAGVAAWKEGDEVVLQPGLSCGACGMCRAGEISQCATYRILGEHLPGTFAEKVRVSAGNVHPAPKGLSWEERAAFPLAGLTAWRMLVTRAGLRPGETVVVHGIGSGVSTFALRIAKLAGARVFVTSADDAKLAKATALGADGVLNYRTSEPLKGLKGLVGKEGAHVVVDSVGEATFNTSIELLARGGRLVTCGATTGPKPTIDLRRVFWKQISILGSTMGTHAEFAALLRAVDAGRLRPVVDSVHPLDRIRDAYARLESGAAFGKIVVSIP